MKGIYLKFAGLALLGTLAALPLAGCGGGGGGSSAITSPVSTIKSGFSATTLMQGKTVQLAASGLTASGSAVNISTDSFTFATSNAAAVTVSTTGLLTGVAPGTSTITITDNTIGKSVTFPVSTITFDVTPLTSQVAPSGTAQFTANITGITNTAVTWSVSPSTGGSISSTGLYTAPAATGTYTITATSQFDNTETATATVTVGNGGAVITVN